VKRNNVIDTRELQIKKGHSWSDQLGIIITLLVEKGKLELVNWTRDVGFHAAVGGEAMSDWLALQILMFNIEKRQRIIDETDGKDKDDTFSDDDETPRLPGPSKEALAKFNDYRKSMGSKTRMILANWWGCSNSLYQQRAGSRRSGPANETSL